MPMVIDWTWNYTTSTSGTTITIDRPQDCQAGDLLLAVLSTDTGTQTWTLPSGWNLIFSYTNNTNLAMAWKIATNSEPTSYTFTYSVSETSNGSILVIRDVDTTNPIASYNRVNFAAARQAMPTATVSRANSLIIYAATHGSTAVIPSIIEGPVSQIYSADGAAHADAVAWSFIPFTGSTYSNVYASVSGTTYNGVLAVVVINPPSSGATLIPPYCAADSCVYVDPIAGTTASFGNTAFAATATTYWTSPLAGRTLANATVSARTDYGINPYRSAGGMTGPTTANTYTGATLVLSITNAVNLTNKMFLVHAMPLVPADIQTIYDAGSGKGLEIGIASSANNGIVWHVHGKNTPFGINRVPIVIHTGNTTGRIDVRGSIDLSAVRVFGFFVCGFLVSSDWVFTMIWILGPTVVCGGNSQKPIELEDIVQAIATGHERMSAFMQGRSQAMFYQEVQIGNGSHPTYLKLENTSIEFPEIYNPQKRLTQYCGVPNALGLTYYAGDGDTIIHRDSVIYSGSKYYWRIHPSSSSNATYDFSGLTIINAGDIQIPQQINIDGVRFIKCDTITSQGSEFTNCLFQETTGDSGALKINTFSHAELVRDCVFAENSIGLYLNDLSATSYKLYDLKFFDNTLDIYINSKQEEVTLCLSNVEVDTNKIMTSGAKLNIITIARLTLTNIPPHSTVRIFRAGTTQVLAGTNDSSDTFVFEYNYGDVQSIDIVVVNLGYEYFRLENVQLQQTDFTIPLKLNIDRWYTNP